MTTSRWRCEAGIVDYSGPTPVVVKCGKTAQLRGTAAVCDGCWDKIRKRVEER